MGYATRRKKKIHAKEHKQKKSMLKSMRRKRRKEKDSPYFQIQNREKVMQRSSKKKIGLDYIPRTCIS
jgi:hypothetical protein